jgi:hypothetical protein
VLAMTTLSVNALTTTCENCVRGRADVCGRHASADPAGEQKPISGGQGRVVPRLMRRADEEGGDLQRMWVAAFRARR